MLLFEIFKVALASLRANKLRSMLTLLGIIVGIFSIIAVSTVVSMLQSSIEEGLSLLGQNTFQIQKLPAIRTGSQSEMAKFRNRKDITLEDYYDLKEKLVEAKSVGAELFSYGKLIKYGNKETNPNVLIYGVSPEDFPNNDWNIDKGRVLNERDVNRYEPVIVLGADIVKKLFEYTDPIGTEVKLDGHKVRVVGILESEGDFFGQSRGNFGILPITTYQNFYGKRRSSLNITVMAHDRESYSDLIEQTEGYMRLIRKVPPGEENDFDIFSNQSLLTQINEITLGVRIGSFIIAGIALLAAGIGIMNIMLVSVTERTREIGIRKAIGARKVNILFQFLTEAVILCLIGGIIGIIIGIAIGNLAGSFLKASATVPLDWVLAGVIMCVLIGVSFGTYPAYKAAQLDPIEALRFE